LHFKGSAFVERTTICETGGHKYLCRENGLAGCFFVFSTFSALIRTDIVLLLLCVISDRDVKLRIYA